MKEKKEPREHVDAELFRQALAGVTPLPPANRAATRLPLDRATRISPQPEPSRIPDSLSDHGAGEVPLDEFLRSGVSRMTLRKLRRGHPPIQDSLDLHGLTSDEARERLQEFLHDAAQRGLRCVRVIHGKGWQPGGGEGVLKARTRHWLTQCAEVLAFCGTSPREGGGGAVKVLLKSGAAN
ncbi:MAG: Smr/MutS family protein [Nitrosomonadales bacterium]|nr:Smr/MutS family protein [Nitrosomonadales bacterium]